MLSQKTRSLAVVSHSFPKNSGFFAVYYKHNFDEFATLFFNMVILGSKWECHCAIKTIKVPKKDGILHKDLSNIFSVAQYRYDGCGYLLPNLHSTYDSHKSLTKIQFSIIIS